MKTKIMMLLIATILLFTLCKKKDNNSSKVTSPPQQTTTGPIVPVPIQYNLSWTTNNVSTLKVYSNSTLVFTGNATSNGTAAYNIPFYVGDTVKIVGAVMSVPFMGTPSGSVKVKKSANDSTIWLHAFNTTTFTAQYLITQ